MKLILRYLLILVLLFIAVSYINAQNRSIHFKFRSIQVDTINRRLVFSYRLGNIAPKDSLSIELVNGDKAPFRLRAVYGDVGTVLTDGKNKKIYWDPVADSQRVNDSPVEVRFVVKTIPGQGLTRWQIIRLGRWAIGAGLTAYTLYKGISIINSVSKYNQKEQPNSLAEKSTVDAERADIQNQQKDFYRIAAISATALLVNLTWSAIQSRHKLKPSKLAVTSANQSIGVSYKL